MIECIDYLRKLHSASFWKVPGSVIMRVFTITLATSSVGAPTRREGTPSLPPHTRGRFCYRTAAAYGSRCQDLDSERFVCHVREHVSLSPPGPYWAGGYDSKDVSSVIQRGAQAGRLHRNNLTWQLGLNVSRVAHRGWLLKGSPQGLITLTSIGKTQGNIWPITGILVSLKG